MLDLGFNRFKEEQHFSSLFPFFGSLLLCQIRHRYFDIKMYILYNCINIYKYTGDIGIELSYFLRNLQLFINGFFPEHLSKVCFHLFFN